MAESLDDSGPLQQLEDVSFDSCDDLEVSMSELTLDYDDDDDQPRSSTPISERSPARTLEDSPIGGKHHLTPSKQDVLPKPKRFHVGVNPSGREVAERRANLELLLREGFELREGYESSVQCVLSYLGFEYQKQSLVSRAVKEVFPGVYTKRETKSGHKQTYYVNLALKCSIAQLSSEHEASSLNDDMDNLLKNLQISDQVVDQIWSSLVSTYNDGGDISALLAEYARESQTRDRHVKTLVKMYEVDIMKLKSDIPKDNLSKHQKATIKYEMKVLEGLCDKNIRGSSAQESSDNISPSLFKEILETVHEKCPLVNEMLEALVISNPVSRNLLKTNAHKMLCGLQTLGFIGNIRNSRTRNCFPMMFGLLCISYGAGKQFIDMLQSMGLSLHWNTIMSYLDKRLNQFQSLIDGCAPISKPVILLLDNLNLYHGNRRHHRLFKVLGPNMWNFTVRGLFVPDLTDIGHLFECKETTEEGQHPKKVTAADTFIETHPEHLEIWTEVQDNFLLQVLDTALNCIPNSQKKFSDMNEREFDQWLKKQDFAENRKQNYDIKVPQLSIQYNPNCSKSETLILPLSLENNATTTGTAAIIQEFGKEFGVPCNHAKEYLPYDNKSKTFDIGAARHHHQFLVSLHEHQKEMAETVRHLTEAEKAFEPLTLEPDTESCTTGNGSTNSKQKIDAKFQKVFDKLVKQMWEAQQANDVAKFEQFIGWLDSHRDHWEKARDHNGRSLLHAAVENENMPLVKTLVSAGVDINAKEGCGATPLTIAVIKRNEEICHFLLENFAIFDHRFFNTIPSPQSIAATLEMDIVHVMHNISNDEMAIDMDIWRTIQKAELVNEMNVSTTEDPPIEDEIYKYERKNKSCVTLFVGDQGTNKVLRGVKGRSEAAYGWCAEVPGDMHAKGYLYEVCKKVMTPGGFMHILQNVLSRRKVTAESFAKKKFQEQNLNRIEEAVRDTAAAFGIAAVLEFKESASFPDEVQMRNCKRTTGHHNVILLSMFKQWISASCEDMTFKYYSQMFALFGPLQQMYHNAIKYGNGVAREASWMIMHPLFAQSNKRNYHTEAMVHIVNFVSVWPLATRELLKRNCSISLNGKEGHNIALDEWVESCVVQPMKNYSTGHTTVRMMQRLMANIDIFGSTRKSYHSTDAFNVHPTTKHHEQDPFPDQLKATNFILRSRFLKPNPERKTVEKFMDPKKASISISNVDAYEAGKKKVLENFNRKLFSLYGIMNEVEMNECEDEGLRSDSE